MTLVKDMIDGSFKPTQGVGGTGDVDPILNDRGDPDEYTRDISKSAMKPELAPTARAAPGPEPIRTHQEPAISLGGPRLNGPT